MALDCSGYQPTINILHAWYQIGSFPFSCGQHHNYSSSTSCPAFDAMGGIVSKCQDYKKCLITVNESSFPGQSCARVRRQLQVFYQCNSNNAKSKKVIFFIAAIFILDIQCSGKVIILLYIYKATFMQ